MLQTTQNRAQVEKRFKRNGILLIFTLCALVLISCGDGDSEQAIFDPQSSVISKIEFSSPAFDDGSTIPAEFTCDGNDASPPLRWSEPPAGTRALAIVVDDPDASRQIFRHWSVYNIPAGIRSFAESQPTTTKLENSTRQGTNDFERIGYGGPCPPKGKEHEYLFFIYALSEPLDLESNASPSEVSAAIRGRVLGTGSFSAMYVRR